MLQQGLYRSPTTALDQDHQRAFDLQRNALQDSGDQQAKQRHDIPLFEMPPSPQSSSVDHGAQQQGIHPLHMPLQPLPPPEDLEQASSSQHWLPAYYWWCQYWQQLLFHSLTAKHVKVEEEEAGHGAIVKVPCSTTTDLAEVKDSEDANKSTDALPPPSPTALLPPADEAQSEHPPWLPSGWTTETQIRRSGSTAGTRDKYYKELKSGRRFRSKTEVFHFLQTGKGRPTKPKCKAISSTSSMICNNNYEGRMVLKAPTAAPVFASSLLHQKLQNDMGWHILEAFGAAQLCKKNLDTWWRNKGVELALLSIPNAASENDNIMHEDTFCNVEESLKGAAARGFQELEGTLVQHFSCNAVEKHQPVPKAAAISCETGLHTANNTMGREEIDAAPLYMHKSIKDQAVPSKDDILDQGTSCGALEGLKHKTDTADKLCKGTFLQHHLEDASERPAEVVSAQPCLDSTNNSRVMLVESKDADPLFIGKSVEVSNIALEKIIQKETKQSQKNNLPKQTVNERCAMEGCSSSGLNEKDCLEDVTERPAEVVSAQPCLDITNNSLGMLVESKDADPLFIGKSVEVSNVVLEKIIQKETKQSQKNNLPKQTINKRRAMEGCSSSGLNEKDCLEERPVFQAPRPVVLACPAVSFKQLQAMGKEHAIMTASPSEQPPEREPLKSKPSEAFPNFKGKGIFGSCKPAQTVPKRPAQGRPSKSPAPKKVKFHSPKKGEQRQASRLWQWLQQPGAAKNNEQQMEDEQDKMNTVKAVLEGKVTPQDQAHRVVQLGGQTQANPTLSMDMDMQPCHMAAVPWGNIPIFMFPNGCGSQVTQDYLQMGMAFPVNSPFGTPMDTQSYWDTINRQPTHFHAQFCCGTQSTVQGVEGSQIYTDYIVQGNVENCAGACSTGPQVTTPIQSHKEASSMEIKSTQFNDRYTDGSQGNVQLGKETAYIPSKQIGEAPKKSQISTPADRETTSLFQVYGGEMYQQQAIQVGFEKRSNLQEAVMYTDMFSKGTRAVESDTQIVSQGGNPRASQLNSRMSWTKSGEIRATQFDSEVGSMDDAQIHTGQVSMEADKSKQAQASPQLGKNAYMYCDSASGAQMHDEEAKIRSQLSYLGRMYNEFMSKEANDRESRRAQASGLGREMEMHAAQQQKALKLKLAKERRKKEFSTVLNPRLDLSKLDPALSSRQRAKAVQKMKTAHGRDLLADLGRRLCRKLLLESMTWLK